jgi:subtilisin-like proprotein convertase family protein/predicted Zn-dependent protease
MKRSGVFLLSMIFTFSAFSQNWDQIDISSISQLGVRNINPDRSVTAYVDDLEIKEILWTAPQELNFNPNTDKHTFINIMDADGNIIEFSIVQYQMMEPGLAKRYDHIRTFHGICSSNPSKRIRINYTVHGLRAVITDGKGQTYIDHLQRNDKNHKIIYRRNDLAPHEDWKCNFSNDKLAPDNDNVSGSRSGDCLFRSYRFSMTTTGEYSNYHGAFSEADSSLVMSAVVTTVDRVNDVFEQDLTMRLVLIDSVDNVFYYDPATDPFSGMNSNVMITQNQTNTDSVIGSSNYDLGHIVSTGGSGLANIGIVCATGFKARGVTGIAVPEGDPFDIDYVAHEIGHQLGAYHTQNNDCQRDDPSAMEPGSASTIMGYAGICAPNVQNNSDAYFHAISIQEMNAELTSNSCHGIISLSNSAPVANPLTNKSIPHSTPFVLDVTATDSDGDVLTYNWEQMDNGIGPVMPPANTNAIGPMFRSIFATTESKRYFPNLDSLTANSINEWEVLPSISRDLNFRVTVRDNTFAPGCTDEQDITLDVDGNAGPFLVTSQNDTTVWEELQSETVTWDVANTNIAPVSCNLVDILISYDGGFTYPTTIVSATDNDGSEVIIVPIGTSTTARIKVKCSDNIFFDINDHDIVINVGTPSFALNTNPSTGSVCEDLSVAFTLESMSIFGYTDPIILAVSDLPIGATAIIANNPISPGSNTTITLDNLDGLSGDYLVKIIGVSGSITKETNYNLTVVNAAILPTLSSPANGSSGAVTQPILSWDSFPGAINYEYQVSSISNGGNIVSSGNTTLTSVIISPELDATTTYYWRVKCTTSCGISPWSNEWTFETGACIIKMAKDLPINISPTGTPTITSSLNIKDKGTVIDLNVVALEGTHSYVSDLNFTLIAPDGSMQAFWSDPCEDDFDFAINFDDEAVSSEYPCPPTDGLTYIPDSTLTVFDTRELQGPWILSVFDDFNFDGGVLNSWGLEICLDNYCDLTVDDSGFSNTNGTLLSAINCAVSGDTIFLETVLAGSTINAGSDSIAINEDIVIIANSNDNIKVLSSGNVPSFIINAGKTVSLIGFDIENLNSTVGVIENNGTLTLKDMDIISGVGLSPIINNNGSNLKIDGTCNTLEGL